MSFDQYYTTGTPHPPLTNAPQWTTYVHPYQQEMNQGSPPPYSQVVQRNIPVVYGQGLQTRQPGSYAHPSYPYNQGPFQQPLYYGVPQDTYPFPALAPYQSPMQLFPPPHPVTVVSGPYPVTVGSGPYPTYSTLPMQPVPPPYPVTVVSGPYPPPMQSFPPPHPVVCNPPETPTLDLKAPQPSYSPSYAGPVPPESEIIGSEDEDEIGKIFLGVKNLPRNVTYPQSQRVDELRKKWDELVKKSLSVKSAQSF